jgi:cytoskeletal protein CcmA (bactofilin family)
MTFESSAQILGKFEGSITSNGDLQIANGAACVAQVKANRITVDGTVEGDVVGRERVKLNAGATVRGDIVAAKLAVEEGATFVGHCSVGADAVKHSDSGRGPAQAKPQGAVEPKKQQPQEAKA